MKDESTGLWSWIADLDVDTSKLRPLPKLSSVDLLLSSADNDFEEIGIGQLQLHPSDCFLKNNTLVCCYFAEQRPGVVWFLCLACEGFKIELCAVRFLLWYKTLKPDYLIMAKASYLARLQLCLLYTSPSPRDRQKSRMPSSA